jgi:8-oxo-dGTP pyrophosphatase MutT (NUDIX family)
MIRAPDRVGRRTKGVPDKRRGERRGRQCAALPFAEEKGELRVLLVTSRETQRWVLPKGWTEKRLSPHALAAKEAFEEAGVVGEVEPRPIGRYRYLKRGPRDRVTPCSVRVFPLRVNRLLDDWPERRERQRRWFSAAEAAMAVEEGGLVTLLLGLAMPDANAVGDSAHSPHGDALEAGSDGGARPVPGGHGDGRDSSDLVAQESGAEDPRQLADQDGEEDQQREALKSGPDRAHGRLAAASSERPQIRRRRDR